MEPETSPVATPWSLTHLLVFRFFFAYWLLYLFPSTVSVVVPLDWLNALIDDSFAGLVTWFGHHILGIDGTINTAPTGSGDRLFDYIGTLLQVILAVLAAGIWSAIDRGRADHRRLNDRIRTWVRYGLGTTLIAYGLVKLVQLQFPFPHGGRLIEPYGESSPMGLLWTFMGYSTPYNVFIGGAEAIGGFLLFFRRTTVLGACVSVGVMGNVVMLNFCYDVPVKLYSSHLLFMAIFLLAPHGRRLVHFFVLGRTVEPGPGRVPFASLRLERARPYLKAVFIIWFMYHEISANLERQGHDMQRADRNELAGLYTVATVVSDGAERPPLITDGPRWYLVHVTTYKGTGAVNARRMDGAMERFHATFDVVDKKLSLTERSPGERAYELTYSWLSQDRLRLVGTVDGAPVTMEWQVTERSFLLVERGFHWISEHPFNR